jgi:2-polyprenyl-3-methyl-5-hydroxy-6-metoxy-1,4-benzoquinol methylase
MLRQRKNMSLEERSVGSVVSESLPEDHIVSDMMVEEAWSKAADGWWGQYGEFGDTNRRYIIDPALLRILGNIDGKRVLDAGCGNGYLCRLLSKRGARVVGVDVSERAIELAKVAESEEPRGVEYYVRSLSDLSIFKKNTFDFVVSNIVLCDLQNLKHAISELHRVLKIDGKLVFSIMHPCFTSPPIHGWVKKPLDSDKLEDWLYWKVDRYFERSTEVWKQGSIPSLYGFHRPLSDYMKILIENKFMLTDFEEPVPLKKDIEEHYRSLGDGNRIAWFLVIGAVKMGS